MELRDKTAVITGAAGGIGRGIALALAKRGCHLALSDVDETGLAETVRMASAYGVRVTASRLDVADRAAIAAYPAAVLAGHPGVDILVNNAGVALNGFFEQVAEEDFEWLFEINFWGVVRMTRAFLPVLKRAPRARIVNISSIFGIIAPPGQTAYSASKFAVRGFSNALRHELDMTDSRIGITVVHPGGVATRIAESSRASSSLSEAEVRMHKEMAKKLLTLSPDTAGEIITDGIARDLPRVLVGSDAKKLAVLERLFPVTYWKILERRRKRLTGER